MGGVRAKVLLCCPGDEALGIDGTGQVGVKVAAFRHPAQERVQLGVIVAHSLEAGLGENCVEVARDQRHANDEDSSREKNNGIERAANHGPTLRYVREARMRLAKEEASISEGADGGAGTA